MWRMLSWSIFVPMFICVSPPFPHWMGDLIHIDLYLVLILWGVEGISKLGESNFSLATFFELY